MATLLRKQKVGRPGQVCVRSKADRVDKNRKYNSRRREAAGNFTAYWTADLEENRVKAPSGDILRIAVRLGSRLNRYLHRLQDAGHAVLGGFHRHGFVSNPLCNLRMYFGLASMAKE